MRPPYRIARLMTALAGLAALLGPTPPARARVEFLPSLVIPNPNPAREARFGWAFAAEGTTLLVGAPGRFDTSTGDGRAYLVDATTGAILRTFASPDAGYGDNFGSTVAMAGGACLVGGQRLSSTLPARAFLFDCASGALLQRFDAPPGAIGFGYAVALAGGDVLVSDPNDTTPAIGSGAVHRFDTATGALIATHYPPESPRGIAFGIALAVSATRFAVGAPQVGAPSAKGTVYVYDTATGAPVFNLRNPTPPPGAIGPDLDYFGGTVLFRGEDVVVGDWDDNFGAQDAGGVYVFSGFDGTLIQTLRSPNLQPGGSFGQGLALDGTTLLVAAPGELRLALTGTVHFFAANGSLTGSGAIGPLALGDAIPRQMHAVGRAVAIGNPFYGAQPQFSGAVIVYAPCQDGHLDVGEECDDGNGDRCDGCDASCRLEPGWQCGDGVLSTECGERCDDGAANSDVTADACRTDCTLPRCGDGTPDGPEECDDGGHGSCDGCGPTCRIELGLVCGDGITQPACGEECDDGNPLGGDGCTGGCVLEFVPGGGARASDCAAGWTVDNPTNQPPLDAHGRFSNKQACVDGDPLCDFDGGAPNSCTFHVRACASATGLDGCEAPTRLRTWELVKPSVNQAARKPVYAAVRAALAGVTPAIVGPSARNFCTDPIALTVPTAGSPAAPFPGKVVLSTRASTYDGRRDSDKLTLVCLPAGG